MGNCLVTKLKSVVNNSDLKKLGVLRFEVDVTSINRRNVFHCNTLNHCKFTIVSGPVGGQIVKVGTSEALDVPLGTEFFLDNSLDAYYFSKIGKYVIEITNKYDIELLLIYHPISILLNDLKYSSSLSKVNFTGESVIGNLEDLITPNMKNLFISNEIAGNPGESVVGDIAKIANTVITNVVLLYCGGIIGNLSSLSSHQTLKTLSITNSTKITGKISDITSIPHLSNFQCANNKFITGSLADLLDNGQLRNPELKILAVNGTPNIVKNSEDVTTLRNLGVQVTV